MSEADSHGAEQVRLATQRLLEAKLAEVRHDEILNTYEDLLGAIWHRLENTLGRTTVTVLMKRALAESADAHAALKPLRVDAQGLSLDPLRAAAAQSPPERDVATLRSALREIVVRLFDILTVLTGDIIVRRMLRDLEETR